MSEAIPPEGSEPAAARPRGLRSVRRAEDQTLVSLRLALNAAQEGVLVCDGEDCILFCNSTCAEMVGVQITPGMTFEAAFRTCFASGKFPDAVGKEEEWIARAMKERRQPGTGMEMRVGERWVHLRNQRTPDGGMLTLIVDITERKLSQQRLAESEAKYRGLVELSSDWFWEQDEAGRFTRITARGVRLAALEEVSLGKARWELPDLEPLEGDWVEHRAKYQRREAFADFLMRRTNPEGVVSFLSSSGAPWYDADGRYVGYRGITRDVTERMRSLLALAESASLFRAIFEQAAIGMAQGSLEGRITEANQKFCQMLGYSRDELVRLTYLDLTEPAEHELARANTERVARGEIASLVREKRLIRKDGSRLWCNITLNLVRTPGGEPDYMIQLIEDVSARKLAEAAALQATSRLRDGLEHLGEMLVLTDAEDRILLANRRFQEFNAAVADHARPGNFYVDHLKAGLQVGLFPDALGREEQWLTERMELRRHPRGPVERKRQDGRWLVVDDQRLPDGGMVSFGVEITERKRAQEQARLARAQLEMAVQYSGVSTWVHDLAGGRVTLSAGWAELLGEPAQEMVVATQDVVRWAHPDELPSLSATFVAVLKGERDTYAVEQRVLTRTGDWKWILSRGRIIERDKSGRALLMVGTNVDVSDTKRTEEALRASEQRFRSLVNLSHDVFWETDAEHRFTRQSFGGSLAPLEVADSELGKTRWEVPYLSPDEEAWNEHRAAIARREVFRDFELSRRTPDGGVRHAQVSGEPAYAASGEFLGYRGVGNDITARKLAEQELLRLNQELEDRVASRTRALETAYRELESFSYSVSHDLRAPLRSISGFASMLREEEGENLTPDGRRYLTVMDESARRMGRLIDALLALARTSRQVLSHETVDLAALAQSVLSELAPQHPRAQVSVEPLPQVQGDLVLLRQVMLNLIGNAFKYSAKAAQPQVSIALQEEASGVTITVRDNGVGFDMAYAGKLFQPFGRLHGDAEFEGTGIGLVLSKLIVERHGGRIWAEAVPGSGAAFSITLPHRHAGSA